MRVLVPGFGTVFSQYKSTQLTSELIYFVKKQCGTHERTIIKPPEFGVFQMIWSFWLSLNQTPTCITSLHVYVRLLQTKPALSTLGAYFVFRKILSCAFFYNLAKYYSNRWASDERQDEKFNAWLSKTITVMPITVMSISIINFRWLNPFSSQQ